MPTRKTLANAIRFLAIDAVQKAKSGHPGMPMGMADIAEVLWNDFLRVIIPTIPIGLIVIVLYYQTVMALCCNMPYCI